MRSALRIAVYHELPSGGAKRALFETARRLAERHVVDVFTVSGADHEFCDLRPVAGRYVVTEFRPRRLFASPWSRLNRWQRWRDLRPLERIGRRTAAELDRGGYHVVYVHPSQWTQAPTVLGSLRTPAVYHVHEPLRAVYEPPAGRPYLDASWSAVLDRLDPIGRRYVRAVRALDLRNTAGATTLLANSRFTAGNVRRIYGRQAPVSYFGVDSARFRPPGDGVRERFVLSVGALRPEKGFDFVIEALALVPAATRPALRIVANADDALERAYLTELAARCGVDLRIEISVSEERLVERYRRAELVVYAPIREPFGLAALEAMACGVPVVGVDEGGVRETVIDGITGRLVERDEAQFADAVAILTADDVLRRRLGEQARRHVVERWSWEAAVASVEEHLVATAGRT